MLQYKVTHIWNGSRDIQMGNIGFNGRPRVTTRLVASYFRGDHFEAFCIGPYGSVKILSR